MVRKALLLVLLSGGALADLIGDCQNSDLFPDCGQLPAPEQPDRREELLDQAYSENEPNNAPGEANLLQPGVPMRGDVAPGDEDWFLFAVAEGGTSATLEIPSHPGVVGVELLQADGTKLHTFRQEKGDFGKTFPIRLAAGRYLLRVTGDVEDYVFLLQGEGLTVPQNRFAEIVRNALWEIEPNNGPQSAKSLVVSEPMKGGFSSLQDEDWFTFSPAFVPGDNTNIKENVVTIELSETAVPVELAFFDTEVNPIFMTTHSGFAPETYRILLPRPLSLRRPFYLRLRPIQEPKVQEPHYAFVASGDVRSFFPSRYTLLLSKAKPEEEPNDSPSSANPVQPGIPSKGQLATRGDMVDVDLFAIEAIRSGALLHFEMPMPDFDEDGKPDSVWRIQIFDEGGNVLIDRASVENLVLLFSVSLPHPGRYFIQVSAVGKEGEVVTTDQSYVFNITGLGIVAASRSDPTPNFNDVEIEPNDQLLTATPLTSGVNMKGHLALGSDKIDLYRIESRGNEILRFELCPDFHPCSQQNAWVLYVFNDRINQRLLDTEINLLSCSGVYPVNHPYLLAFKGLFDGVLIGTIDMTYPDSKPATGRLLEVAVPEPGVYYVGISSPLKKENGDVILEGTCPSGETFQFIETFPYSDDQYLFRVFATKLDPVTGDDPAKASLALVNHDQVYLPHVVYRGLSYRAYLALERRDGQLFARLRHAELIGTAIGEAATFDGRYLLVPEVEYGGGRYRADLELVDPNGWLFKVVAAEALEKP